MKKKIVVHSILQFILMALFIGLDQWTKQLAVLHLKGQEAVVLIEGALELRYLENAGAAFSIFQNKQLFFYILTAVVLIIIFALWGRVVRSLLQYRNLKGVTEADGSMPFQAKTFRNGIFLNYLLILLVAGALGNFIDRLRLQYVIDFIYVRLINFPIFNVADICVTISAVLLVVFFLFIYKDDRNFNIWIGKKH